MENELIKYNNNMADKIINYEDLQKEYGEMTDMIIENFESTCFDQRMDGLL